MTTTGMRLPTLANRYQDFKNTMKRYRNLDGNRCSSLSGFPMLNDDEIVTSVQAEFGSVDDEMDKDENKNSESSKNSSNARDFCVRDSYRLVRTTIRVRTYSITAAQENQIPCSKKTKVTMVQRKI
ncbi:hypothetical protein TNCV_722691 [Trichonephila clavipes]|nr:hypothetical protein TNCV_722691 [Trichonephila clavipes]